MSCAVMSLMACVLRVHLSIGRINAISPEIKSRPNNQQNLKKVTKANPGHHASRSSTASATSQPLELDGRGFNATQSNLNQVYARNDSGERARLYFLCTTLLFWVQIGPAGHRQARPLSGRCHKALPHAQQPADSFSEPEGFGLHLISAQVPFIRPILKTGISSLVSG